jgi:hypothetical protein
MKENQGNSIEGNEIEERFFQGDFLRKLNKILEK